MEAHKNLKEWKLRPEFQGLDILMESFPLKGLPTEPVERSSQYNLAGESLKKQMVEKGWPEDDVQVERFVDGFESGDLTYVIAVTKGNQGKSLFIPKKT